MEFGMPTMIENKSLKENIALCKRLELNFIELNMNFPEYQLDKLSDTDSFVDIADENEIYYTIHLDENLDIADFNKLVSGAYSETVHQTIEIAKKMVILSDKFGDLYHPMVINMHMNHGIHITLPDGKVQMYERDFATYIKSFEAFRDNCEKWIGNDDIRIVIENTDGFREYEKKAIDYLLQSKKFGLTWDIGHSKAVGETDVPFIKEREKHLCHFHIHDASEKPARNHLALGDGELDIKNRLEYAKKLNARCVLETKTIAALEKSVSYLNELNL